MCLITCGFGGLCDAKEIRMAFSCLPGAPRRNFQPRSEIPRDTPFYEGSVLKNKSVADRCEVKVARSLGISEGRREFPPRSGVPRTPLFGRGAPRA